MNKIGVWGIAAMLALGLAACDGDAADGKPPLEPGGGFKAEVQPGIRATLTLPDRVSPDAALIQARVALDNTAADIQTVTVPRPCDVHDWVIRDPAGKLLMTKGPIACVEQPATKDLAPGNALSEQVFIYLLPNLLESGKRYTVDYRFWGQPARAEFTAGR